MNVGVTRVVSQTVLSQEEHLDEPLVARTLKSSWNLEQQEIILRDEAGKTIPGTYNEWNLSNLLDPDRDKPRFKPGDIVFEDEPVDEAEKIRAVRDYGMISKVYGAETPEGNEFPDTYDVLWLWSEGYEPDEPDSLETEICITGYYFELWKEA